MADHLLRTHVTSGSTNSLQLVNIHCYDSVHAGNTSPWETPVLFLSIFSTAIDWAYLWLLTHCDIQTFQVGQISQLPGVVACCLQIQC